MSLTGRLVGITGMVLLTIGANAGGSVAEQKGALAGATVTATPLGSAAGDLCRSDRAILFEDPTGVRILYDPGRTVNGGADTRLGDVHVVLLSHAHGDHIGDQYVGTAGCGAAPNGSVFAQSNVAAIAAAKGSMVVAGGELAGAATSSFLNRKIQNLTGTVTPNCPTAGLANETPIPSAGPCVAVLRVGGSRTVRLAGAAQAVKIAAVQAVHPDGIPASLIDAPSPGTSGTTGYGGEGIGFVVTFTNGLTVYLSGDTGMFGDMGTIIRDYYGPSLVIFNMGDLFTTGPDEAAFAIRRLLKPVTVMPSHSNEASTAGGAVNPGTRLERFITQVGSSTKIVVPLSDVPLAFDGLGRCVNCP